MSSPERALAEAIAFLQGVGDKEPGEAAAYVIEQLALRGFSIQANVAVLHDYRPETLQRVRKAMGITRKRLAEEASVNPTTVSDAESGARRSQAATLRILGDALVRLGARRP